MIKRFLLCGVVFAFIGFLFSCTKDKAETPLSVTCAGVDSSANTYNLRIKFLINANCGSGRSCHDELNHVANGGGVLMDSYSNTKDAFQIRKGLCSIKGELGCIAMPYTPYPKLADSLIQYIHCWAANGYPQ